MKGLASFFEEGFYSPSFFHKFLSYLFLPFSLIYCFFSLFSKIFCKKYSFDIPIISVGNLIVGGSGKTPLVIALAKRYKKSCVVLRGYMRKSKGVVVVSRWGEILTHVSKSGDEAMVIADEIDGCVIVSENRVEGIKKAKELGCEVVFLDDGFRHCIEKFDILIDKETKNSFCLPSGPYRLPKSFYKRADLVLREDRDFIRETKILNPTSKMVLVTSIANPKRLDSYIFQDIPKYYFKDHHNFTLKEIEEIYKKEGAKSLLVTKKDLVKLKEFPFSYSLIQLNLKIKDEVFKKIDSYIKDFYAKKAPDSSDAS